MQQYWRARRQRDRIEEPGYLVCPQRWEAQRPLLADALGALAGHEGRPVGGPPVLNGWRLYPVQRCDGFAQLACQQVAVLGRYLVPDGVQRDTGQAAHQYVAPPVVFFDCVDLRRRGRQLACQVASTCASIR
jgi:hypothetical protein